MDLLVLMGDKPHIDPHSRCQSVGKGSDGHPVLVVSLLRTEDSTLSLKNSTRPMFYYNISCNHTFFNCRACILFYLRQAFISYPPSSPANINSTCPPSLFCLGEVIVVSIPSAHDISPRTVSHVHL